MNIDIYNTNNKYDVIYADPPWSYRQSKTKGSAERHYKTMITDDICNLPISKISNDKTICFIWATFPNITEALKVMSSWGFEYKTAAFVWVKKTKSGCNAWGMGAYTRANAEVCLLGVSKHTKAKNQIKSHAVHQIIESIVEEHSKKPSIVRDKIVELCGDVSRIELFARQQIKGWDSWGDEL